MAKFDPYSISPKERNKILNEFYSLVASLRTKQQIISFFKDLLTPSERVMMARRIQIAKLLLQGYGPMEISRKLKTGVDTIAKVQRWLKERSDEYAKILKR